MTRAANEAETTKSPARERGFCGVGGDHNPSIPDRTAHSHGEERALPIVVMIAEDRRDVLSKGEKTDDVDMVTSFEIEPATREPLEPARAQSWNTTEFTNTHRPRARHTPDQVQHIDSCVEEPLTEIIASNLSVVANPINQVGLSERSKSNLAHKAEPSARPRSSPTTSSLNRRPSPELEPVRNQQTKTTSSLVLLVTTNQISQVFTRVSVVPRADPLIDVGPQRLASCGQRCR